MDNHLYLEKALRHWIEQPKKNSYWRNYNLMRTKRFLSFTMIIFIFQYLTTIHLPFSSIAFPLYPPIGIAFTAFYLFGSQALFGLLLGGFCGYFLQGLPITTLALYLSADLICAYLGALLCQPVLSSDIRPFAKSSEMLKFFMINAFVVCPFSSLLRLLVLFFNLETSMFQAFFERVGGTVNINYKTLFFYYADLWLADLSAIFIFSAFLLSWVYVPFSREKIIYRPIKLLVTGLVLLIIFSLVFIKRVELIYFIIAAMLVSLYLSKLYRYLIAMVLLFVMSCLYLVYFMIFKQYYLQNFGIALYTLFPLFLLFYSLCLTSFKSKY